MSEIKIENNSQDLISNFLNDQIKYCSGHINSLKQSLDSGKFKINDKIDNELENQLYEKKQEMLEYLGKIEGLLERWRKYLKQLPDYSGLSYDESIALKTDLLEYFDQYDRANIVLVKSFFTYEESKKENVDFITNFINSEKMQTAYPKHIILARIHRAHIKAFKLFIDDIFNEI